MSNLFRAAVMSGILSTLLSCLLVSGIGSGSDSTAVINSPKPVISMDLGFVYAFSANKVSAPGGDKLTLGAYRPNINTGIGIRISYPVWAFEFGRDFSCMFIDYKEQYRQYSQNIWYDGAHLAAFRKVYQWKFIDVSAMGGLKIWYGGMNIGNLLMPLFAFLWASDDQKYHFIMAPGIGADVQFHIQGAFSAYIKPGLFYHFGKVDPNAFSFYTLHPLLPTAEFGLRFDFTKR